MSKVFLNMNTNRKKIQSPLTYIVVYDLETFNKIRVVPYRSCIYKLGKSSGEYNRDKSEQEFQKCLNEYVDFNGPDCIIEHVNQIMFYRSKEKLKKSIIKLVNTFYN